MAPELRRLVLLTSIMLIPYLSECYKIEDFVVNPRNPKEGDSVSVECSYHPASDIVITWSKDGNTFGRNSDFLDEEYENQPEISLYTDRYSSVLNISSVSRRDSGNYTCRMYACTDLCFNQPEKTPYVIDEQSVILYVTYYPNSNFPSCEVKTDTGLNGIPPIIKQENGTITSEIRINRAQARSADVYTCSVTSADFFPVQTCFIDGSSIPSTFKVTRNQLSR